MVDGNSDFNGMMGGIQAMGIMNALPKTGDTRVDMVLAMCVPFLIRLLVAASKKYECFLSLSYWLRWFSKPIEVTPMHHRYIKFTSESQNGRRVSADVESQNRVLQKAIETYLHSEVELNLREADTNLTSIEVTNGVGLPVRRNGNNARNTVFGMLSSYQIVKNPPQGQWHMIGYFGGEEGEAEECDEVATCATADSSSTSNIHHADSAAVFLQVSQESNNSKEDRSEGLNGNKGQSTVTFHLKSKSGIAIDSFIKAAHTFYMKKLKQLEDDSRYLYELKKSNVSSFSSSDDDDDSGSVVPIYSRYPLSDEKTFESLFFPDKRQLLQLIKHFEQRSGKYAVKGYPHKLGLLLHGPPGSGKTSLIKALAHLTGRSVINVPLSRIETNAELMALFNGNSLRVAGQYVPINYGFKDVIFVIEDVDAASKIVKRRDGKKTASMVQTDRLDLSQMKSPWIMLLQSRNAQCKEVVKMLVKQSERLREAAKASNVLCLQAKQLNAYPGLGLVGDSPINPAISKLGDKAIKSAKEQLNRRKQLDEILAAYAEDMKNALSTGAEVDPVFEDFLMGKVPPSFSSFLLPSRDREVSYTKYDPDEDGHVDVDVEARGSYKTFQPPHSPIANDKSKGLQYSSYYTEYKKMDDLNLQGLLNVLDGVVDSPGRIVIMSTNHPEKLDPALIRPGRVDKKLLLGYMESAEMVEMIEHYFQTVLTKDQVERVRRVLVGIPPETTSKLKLTPAQVEQMTAEHEDVEAMVVSLEKKARLLIPHVGRVAESSEVAFDI